MKCQKHTTESRNILKQSHLKSTDARLHLLDIFKHANKPVSVGDLFDLLKEHTIDKVTIYRNVESLAALGILRQVRLKDRQSYYELVSHDQHHHHMTCIECGLIKDVPVCADDVVSKKFLSTAGFARITEHSLEFFGICNVCAKKTKHNA